MIKVIIERFIADDMATLYDATIKESLKDILETPGYIKGASYRDAKNPNHRFIITDWLSEAAWQKWASSPQRRNSMSAIRAILQSEEKITILRH